MNEWLFGKDPDAGKDWRQEKRMTEDEMVGWHHWFNGQELGQTPGDGEGQGGLAYCSPWYRKNSDTTWQLNNNKNEWTNTKNRTCLETHKGFPVGSDGEESACNAGDLGLTPGSGRSPWRKEWIFTPVFLPWKFYRQRSLVGYSSWGHKEQDMTEGLELSLLGFPGASDNKESACNAEDLGLTPGSGRSPGEWNGYPLQYSCLENSTDRGTWRARVHGVMMSWTQLSD